MTISAARQPRPTRRSRASWSTGLIAAVPALVLAGCAAGPDSATPVAQDAETPTSQGAPGADGPAAGDPASSSTPSSDSSSSPSSDSSEAPTEGGPATRAGSVLLAEAPRTVVLPSGTDVPVRSVSTTPDGTLDVPDDIRKAGWWRGGSRLADPFGSTLIAGHIDSTTQGLGPFAELLQAQAGDRVEVRSRRLVQPFVVRSLELVPRSTVNTLPSIFGPSGGRRLVLVTCAPPYDSANGGYQNLALVTAMPESDPKRAAR